MADCCVVAVKAIASSLGIELKSAGLAEILAQDAEFRVTQIIEPASLLNRCSNSAVFTADHLNMILSIKNLAPLVGYSNRLNFEMKSVSQNESQDKSAVHFVIDPKVNLESIVSKNPKKLSRSVPFSCEWKMVQGITLNGSFSNRRMTSNPYSRVLPITSIFNFQSGMMQAFSDKVVDYGIQVREPLDKELYEYYDKAVEILRGNDTQMQMSVCESLSCDTGIQPLLPIFIRFLYSQIAQKLNVFETMRMVSNVSHSLISNPSMPTPFYSHSFMKIAMTLCVTPILIGSSVEEDCEIREFGASLISEICERSIGAYPGIVIEVQNQMSNYLFSAKTAFNVQYGSLVSLMMLGEDVFISLLPHLPFYVKNLLQEIKLESHDQIKHLNQTMQKINEICSQYQTKNHIAKCVCELIKITE